jgi:cytochrome P450
MNFSAGPRSCLGKQLALLETKITLIKLFKRYKTIKLEKKISEWEMEFQFLYTPQKFMTILKR